MRWITFYFSHSENSDSISTTKERDRLKIAKCPPNQIKLNKYEKYMLNVMNKLNFSEVQDNFQRKCKEDLRKSKVKLFVFDDKCRNVYKMEPNKQNKTNLLMAMWQRFIERHQVI